jgi:hypothetical protein
MSQSDCKHPKMTDHKTGKSVRSSCPDCGFVASSSNEEVDEVTQEVLDDVQKKTK